jgi:hypothetical protein
MRRNANVRRAACWAAVLAAAATLGAWPGLCAEENATVAFENRLEQTVRVRVRAHPGERTETLRPGTAHAFRFSTLADCADQSRTFRIEDEDGSLLAAGSLVVRGVIDTVGLARWCHMRVQEPMVSMQAPGAELRFRRDSASEAALILTPRRK